MKRFSRYGLLAFVLLVTPLGLIAHAQGDARVIPVIYAEYRDTPTEKPTDGSSCLLQNEITDRVTASPLQVIVTNERGETVGVATLTGTVKLLGGEGAFVCTAEASIEVPDASFYTVTIGEYRARTYAAQDFPLEGPEDAAYITVSSP